MRVHRHDAGAPKKNGDQSIGRSHEGLTTKIHALVDGLGMFAPFSLTGGQASDTGEALPLLGELKPLSLDADKAFDTNAILQRPKSGGQSLHGLPVRAIHKTASTNSRLSAAVLPGSEAFPGKNELIRSYWSSLSINLGILFFRKKQNVGRLFLQKNSSWL